MLASVLANTGHGIWFNDHIEGDGPTVFRHACKLGLEGIVSKRKDSPYRSGRSNDWLRSKNPACAAVKRASGPEPASRSRQAPPHRQPRARNPDCLGGA